jgi:hypothetical protein
MDKNFKPQVSGWLGGKAISRSASFSSKIITRIIPFGGRSFFIPFIPSSLDITTNKMKKPASKQVLGARRREGVEGAGEGVRNFNLNLEKFGDDVAGMAGAQW